jgi:acyl-CoA synthetase (AMP-forming)/AMP-acid ligase II
LNIALRVLLALALTLQTDFYLSQSPLQSASMLRTELYADPAGRFVHDVVLDSCRKNSSKTALIDTSCNRRLTFSEYGSLVETVGRGLISAGLAPGEVIAIFLPNSWEFAITYHAATLAGGIPTLLNPSYREREIRYQLENSGAAFLITDGPLLENVNLAGLSNLRRIFTTRSVASESAGSEDFAGLLRPTSARFPEARQNSQQTIAALPYSSGTTGMPKGVMLSHYNLVANVYQTIGPNATALSPDDVILCFLPLYHIYGLTVALTLSLTLGSTLVLMPRFDVQKLCALLISENVTMMFAVPPAINALCQAVEAGIFPRNNKVRWIKSGAAPLAPELARRFTDLTGIIVTQGYGMTEASPVTHVGYNTPPEMKRPASIGQPLALTECRIVDPEGNDVAPGEAGELVMRGPQIMLGYWKEPQATAAVLRDGWYFSGDIVRKDADGFYYVLDRSKEMIKYKGFPVAPAEVEAVLLEHSAVRDCGVVAKPDLAAGEIPCAFVVLREGFSPSDALEKELCNFVADRLAHHKQPREVRFVDAVPRTPSGKILRRELRKALS